MMIVYNKKDFVNLSCLLFFHFDLFYYLQNPKHCLVVYQIAPEFVITNNKYTIKKSSHFFPVRSTFALI